MYETFNYLIKINKYKENTKDNGTDYQSQMYIILKFAKYRATPRESKV